MLNQVNPAVVRTNREVVIIMGELEIEVRGEVVSMDDGHDEGDQGEPADEDP